MKRNPRRQFAIIAALAATTAPLIAAPGSLDTSFNGTGIAILLAGKDARSVVALPDGKIVVAGTSTFAGHSDIMVARYLANGSLDTSFSFDGIEITPIFGSSQDTATGMVVQPDGKIVVVGYTNANGNGNNDMLAVRYNANGGLDTSFGIGNGKYSINFGNTFDDRASSVALQPDGKIMIGGTKEVGPESYFAVARLTSAGILDPFFSGDGALFDGLGSGADEANAVLVQSDGKIVLVGSSEAAGDGLNNFALMRLNSDGTLDTTFDSDGKVTTSILQADRAVTAMIQPDGKIIAAGSTANSADSCAVRYNPDGSLDTSFSGDGIFQESFGSISGFSSVVMQADGKIVLGGSSGLLAARNSNVIRLMPSGIRDISFDGDGYVISDFALSNGDFIFDIAIQPDGRLIAVGQLGNTPGDFLLARYNMFQKTDSLVGAKISAFVGDDIYNGSGAGQAITISIKKTGKKKSGFVKIQNDGHETDSFKITGAKGNKRFKVKYFNGATNVTKLVNAGTFTTAAIASGAFLTLRVEVTTLAKSEGKLRNFLVTASSIVAPDSVDAVLITAKGAKKK